jgi:uncharacterized protein (DUF1697 family)
VGSGSQQEHQVSVTDANSEIQTEMTIYIAMLRGINVSGHKVIKMDRLRASFEALGLRNVATYVQSGNVVFEAGKESAASLGANIGKRILSDFGFPVPVFLRTADELERIVRDNPFLKQAAVDDSKLHVTFLSAAAPPSAGKDLAVLAVKPEQFHIHGHEIYLCCPNGYGRTRLSNTAIEKKLGVEATTRNWKTANALLAMARP